MSNEQFKEILLTDQPVEEVKSEQVELVTKPKAPDTPPEEVAAQMFYLYLPKFMELVDGLSNKASKRLLKALMEHPLAKQEYKHPTPEEKIAFIIGQRLFDAKYVMIFDTYTKNLDTFQKAADEAVSTETQGDNNVTT